MIDQQGRTIEYMRVSVTDRCNLRCVYCMPAGGVTCVRHDDILTYDEITRICRIGAELGISRIKLTGGEPLVRRGLPELLGMIRRLPGIEQVTLTTNGILLKEKINELVSNGLDSVNISIDTLDGNRYREITRGGELNKVLSGIETALKVPSLKVKINCVPMTETPRQEYIRLARLARDHEMDVRFIEMMPIGLGRKYGYVSGRQIYQTLKNEFGEAKRCSGRFGNGPAVYVCFPGFIGKIGFIDAVSHQFCEKCNRVRLTSEGYLKPCLQYGAGTDLRDLMRSGADDGIIRDEMRRTIYDKPACHHFGECACGKASGKNASDGMKQDNGEMKYETRDMSQIGG
nr:GTP 3',8-cyclase MoaA [uncultured Mediterraneibacter sp.]